MKARTRLSKIAILILAAIVIPCCILYFLGRSFTGFGEPDYGSRGAADQISDAIWLKTDVDPGAVWRRDEFRALVEGKTEEQVLEAVGSPDSRKATPYHEYWYYIHKTRDPAAGHVDFYAHLVFTGGVADRVYFH